MGNPEKIRVILADDHQAFREGLSRLLIEEGSLEVIEQAANGEETVTLTQKLNPDVVIMDIAMPRLNGIEATKKIKKVSPQTVVLILSAFRYQSFQLAALRVGAAGYLTKDTPVREVVKAVCLASEESGISKRRAVNILISDV